MAAWKVAGSCGAFTVAKGCACIVRSAAVDELSLGAGRFFEDFGFGGCGLNGPANWKDDGGINDGLKRDS